MTDNFRVDISSWPDVQDAPRPPGGFNAGSSYLGGPMFTDPFGAKRAPGPWQLIELYRNLIYAMAAKNRNAVCKTPLRLYADGSRAQGGKPRSACDPIRVLRSVGQRLARDGKVSPSAVDKVYEIRTHPLISLVDKPDPYGYFSRTKLIGLMVTYADVVGGAFLMPDWDNWRYDQPQPNRVPEYLWALYPQYIVPIRWPDSPLISVWQYLRDRIPFQALMWFRHSLSLRDPYGSSYSPAYAGKQYSDQEEKFIAIYDQVLGLGPRPSLIATAKDPLQPPGEAERKRLEQDMNRRHAAGNAGNVLVNNGAWDFQEASYAPADMAGKEVSEYDLHRLAAIFGQPPTYWTVDTNLANLQAADQQHARDGVEPRCRMIAETLTHLTQRYDPRLFWQFDPALPEDEKLKTEITSIMMKDNRITINQANEEEQYPPVPWGDEPWIAGTLVQPSMAQEKHEQGMQQADEQHKAGMDQMEAGTEATKNTTDNADMPASEQFKAKEAAKKTPGDKQRTMDAMIERALDRLEQELAGAK